MLLLFAMVGCRAALPAGDETPLQQGRVYNGRPLPRSGGTFTSTAADLAPIQESMRATLRFDADLTGAGFAWDFEGSTEDYDPLITGFASHTGPIDHVPRPSIVVADYLTLRAELAALTADPGLAALLGSATLPPLPTSSLTDGIQIGFRFDQTSVRWLPPALGGGSGATLSVAVPLDVRIDLDDLLAPMFDLDVLRTVVDTQIDATPCGACTSPQVACVDAPGVVAAGYRVPTIARGLGYSSTDADATYPDMGLNLVARTPTATTATVLGNASFNAACPFVFANTFSPTFLDIFNLPPDDPQLAALLFLVEFGRSVLGIFKYIAGIAACQIAANLVNNEVGAAVSTVGPSFAPAFNLLVNPPAFGRGLPGIPLPGLAPGSVIERGVATIALSGGPSGGAVVPLTGPSGGYTDALFNTIALGGAAAVTTTFNLSPVTQACQAGVGLSVFDRMVVCPMCAPGGICTSPGSACAFFCTPEGAFSGNALVPEGIGAPTSVTIAPAPTVAALLSVAPQFSETLRRWFSAPLPSGARYSSATATAGFGANFAYVVDGDRDCAVDAADRCPEVFDPSQVNDLDGDRYGAACDLCPGVNNSASDANEDSDGDGTANGCDCDIDGDGCNNGIFGSLLVCSSGPDGIRDRAPRSSGTSDFDEDGTPDDCDNDRDDDGVLDMPSDGTPPDNCPLGDGDGVFEPSVDQNPSQTNSGGIPDGDICDVLCPGPGAPGCDFPFGGGGAGAGGFGPGAGGLFVGFPGIGACIGLPGGQCDLRAFFECPGGDYDLCWRPDAFASAGLVDALGQRVGQIDAAQLGLAGGFSGRTTTLPDQDGDGLEELLISAPRAVSCPQGFECLGGTGVLVVVGSSQRAVLGIISGGETGGLFGASFSRLGDVLAVGSPGSSGGAGSVMFFRTGPQGLSLLRTIRGESGHRLGTDVAPAFGADTAAPSFLLGAPGASGGNGEIFIANASQGTTQRLIGTALGGAMSRGVAVGDADDFVVVAGVPLAESGRGRVVFYRRHGLPIVRRGAPGARLGEFVVVVDDNDVVASAAGVRSVMRFTRRGDPRPTLTSTLPLFGSALESPGDLNGDGRDDLVVGFGLDLSGAEMAALTMIRNLP